MRRTPHDARRLSVPCKCFDALEFDFKRREPHTLRRGASTLDQIRGAPGVAAEKVHGEVVLRRFHPAAANASTRLDRRCSSFDFARHICIGTKREEQAMNRL